jgi:hypothetical protein
MQYYQYDSSGPHGRDSEVISHLTRVNRRFATVEKKIGLFQLRISGELKRGLERMAKDDGRSLNSYLSRVLLEHIGRAATGKEPILNFRPSPDLTERIEAWGAHQSPPLSRSEAIRALIERGLAKPKKGG